MDDVFSRTKLKPSNSLTAISGMLAGADFCSGIQQTYLKQKADASPRQSSVDRVVLDCNVSNLLEMADPPHQFA